MNLTSVIPDPITNMPIVVLREVKGARLLPIWVGVFEAQAIQLQMENVETPRPMTHDLLKSVIAELGGRVERVVVSELKDNTFYARLEIHSDTGRRTVDARPSDAIALALRAGARIYVEEAVIQSARTVEAEQEDSAGREKMNIGRLQKWLEGLTDDELGKYKM